MQMFIYGVVGFSMLAGIGSLLFVMLTPPRYFEDSNAD